MQPTHIVCAGLAALALLGFFWLGHEGRGVSIKLRLFFGLLDVEAKVTQDKRKDRRS